MLLAGCSGSSSVMGGDNQPMANPGTSPVHNVLFGRPAQPNEGGPQKPDASMCPPADVRDGTNIYRIGPDSATAVRYQGTISDTVRECMIEGNNMRIRVGVEGRVVAGPAGGPGTVTLPVRMTLMTSLNGSVVLSKFRSVPVTIGSDGAATFSFVEDNITFALPPVDKIGDYLIFVGFDSKGSSGDAPARRKKRR